MKRLTVAGVTLLAACNVGPRYHPATIIAPSERVGAARLSDSSQHFFDSLAVERARDSTPEETQIAPRPTLDANAVSAAAWLDIIHDSTLVTLIDVALRQNRDLQRAVARINEYRADVGV
jgi:outer membrane protein TolC